MRDYSIKDPDGRMVNKVKVDGKEVKVSRIEGLKPDEIKRFLILSKTVLLPKQKSRDHT
jgi:predicted metal-dependent hydrolase